MWETSIYPLAEKLGVKMNMPTIKPYSRIAHEASKWAETQGNFDEFKRAVFRAYFERDENISEIQALLSIAKDLNLEVDSLQNALEANKFLEDVLTDEIYAEGIGLHSVPAFIADKKNGLAGLQTAETLRRLIKSV